MSENTVSDAGNTSVNVTGGSVVNQSRPVWISTKDGKSMNENKTNTANWITRKNNTQISLSTMYYSRWKKKVLIFPDRFKRQDMAPAERENFDKFMNFAAQIVQKYGKFGL